MLALRPDVAAVIVGVNDTLRRTYDIQLMAAGLGRVHAALAAQGTALLTACLPDPGAMLRLPAPLARPLARRQRAVNAVVHALAGRYGHAAHNVLRVAEERGELAQPIVEGLPDLLAEATFSARHEQARSVGDVLLRRTHLAFVGGMTDRTLREVAEAVAGPLGWDAARVDEEIAAATESLRTAHRVDLAEAGVARI